MHLTTPTPVKACILGLLLALPLNNGQTIQLHGSGTTNPSKCYWRIMSQMMQQAKLPLHMTYRAVGSSTGIFETVGVNNTTPFSYKAYNDFGSGDIPIPSATYEDLKANNVEVAHFPFVLGAISFFHSIPDMENGSNGLNLTSCQLARIFKREIIYWDDAGILIDNPNLEVPFKNYPIKVAHRVQGSSSTASITQVSQIHSYCSKLTHHLLLKHIKCSWSVFCCCALLYYAMICYAVTVPPRIL